MINNIKNKLHGFRLGRFRTWVTRLAGYLSMLNFGMILYNFVLDDPLGISKEIWLVLAVVGVPAIMLFDIVIMMPSELEYTYDKNKRFIDLEKKVDRVLVLLGDKNE